MIPVSNGVREGSDLGMILDIETFLYEMVPLTMLNKLNIANASAWIRNNNNVID